MAKSTTSNGAPKSTQRSTYDYVHKLENEAAAEFFMEEKQYINFELPNYFNFDKILKCAAHALEGKQLKDICEKKGNKGVLCPSGFAGVNYTILGNKDGKFAWRPFQIINPILYTDLVNTITHQANWQQVKEFFERRDSSKVECVSLIPKSTDPEKKSNHATMVSQWYKKFEQASIKEALDYRFMFQTDISNCYSSIYTHSLEWAFHEGGRPDVKRSRSKRQEVKNLGSEIDKKLRDMNQGQTIGIPQGSTLMDFIAEIVLGGTDIELTKKIKKDIDEGAKYKILRYRDDYRIFSDDYQTGHQIMKILSGVLYDWSMSMNASKTSETGDIVTASVKSEKLEEIYAASASRTSQDYLNKNFYKTIQKEAMRIYILSKKYPNSGLVGKNLGKYCYKLLKCKESLMNNKFEHESVLTIIAMIGFHSPRHIHLVATVVTWIIRISDQELNRQDTIGRIIKKFKDLPNTEMLDIWLQRITHEDEVLNYRFKSEITQVAQGKADNKEIWDWGWLNEKTKASIETVPISRLKNKVAKRKFTPMIKRREVELFRTPYDG